MRHAILSTIVLLGVSFATPPRASADDWTRDERRALARHGWGAFFAQTGFALAATSSALVMRDAGWSFEGDEPAVGLLIPALTGGGAAIGYLTEDWSPEVGWALAGTWPGAALGVSASLGVALMNGQSERDTLLEAFGGGLLAGAAAGALTWLLETLDRGRPGALTGCFWGGYFTGLASGFAAMIMGAGPESQGIPLITAAVGGLIGIALAEAIRAGT